MKSIYKYVISDSLPFKDIFNISMKKDAEILKLDIQFGKICIWCMIDSDNDDEIRMFEIYGTGEKIKDLKISKYIDTVQESDGRLVWHIFEIIN